MTLLFNAINLSFYLGNPWWDIRIAPRQVFSFNRPARHRPHRPDNTPSGVHV